MIGCSAGPDALLVDPDVGLKGQDVALPRLHHDVPGGAGTSPEKADLEAHDEVRAPRDREAVVRLPDHDAETTALALPDDVDGSVLEVVVLDDHHDGRAAVGLVPRCAAAQEGTQNGDGDEDGEWSHGDALGRLEAGDGCRHLRMQPGGVTNGSAVRPREGARRLRATCIEAASALYEMVPRARPSGCARACVSNHAWVT